MQEIFPYEITISYCKCFGCIDNFHATVPALSVIERLLRYPVFTAGIDISDAHLRISDHPDNLFR